MVTPQIGDYACIPVHGTTGLLIRIGQWLNGNGFKNYEHAEVYVGGADKNAPLGYTMGAYPEGASLHPVPAVQWQQGWLWSTGHIELTPAQRMQITKVALACKGIPYSELDFVALALHRFHIPVPGLKAYIGSSHQMICSQLVDFCYRQAGVQLFPGEWPGYVTPAMLANRILS